MGGRSWEAAVGRGLRRLGSDGLARLGPRVGVASVTIVAMLGDVAAGGVLVAGAMACAAAAVVRRDRGGRVAGVAFALALACAAAGAFEGAGGDPVRGWWSLVACALAAVGIAVLVLVRAAVSRLSWLDAAMGGSAAGALAVSVGAGGAAAVAAAGAAGALALSRWRPGGRVLAAVGGVVALAAGGGFAVLAAGALAFAAWRREPPADAGPEFSRVVLSAVLAFAAAALALLAVGQFMRLDVVAIALAIATVLAGMARAGLTVAERLRESQRQAVTDPLTGLGNRRLLVERLDAATTGAAAHGREFALLLIDLDGFKELNDTLGHHAGDEVLRQLGPRLGDTLREHDTLARLGGDEFAVVLAPGDEATASAAGMRLREALERSFTVGDISVHVDASVGIALFPGHARDGPGLLQRADIAMYDAKRTRTGHQVYRPARDRHSRERLSLVGELRGALAADQLVVHYQPKADLATGAVGGVEALVRWAHPQRGLLAPAAFLPLVEQSGLTRALTSFVLDRALEEIGQRRDEGFDLSVAVNLGPADLLDLDLPAHVARLIERRGFPPQHVRLEVSENAVMADPQRTADVLAGLRAIGVGISLDDFGAGHSSLGHLKHLALDELKIDRSFVMGLTRDAHDAAIVQSTVEMARRLGLHVVAEGVEDPHAWTLLEQWMCDEAQGYLLARPAPAAQLANWLGDRAARGRPDPRARPARRR